MVQLGTPTKLHGHPRSYAGIVTLTSRACLAVVGPLALSVEEMSKAQKCSLQCRWDYGCPGFFLEMDLPVSLIGNPKADFLIRPS